jgi:hypothetical protein
MEVDRFPRKIVFGLRVPSVPGVLKALYRIPRAPSSEFFPAPPGRLAVIAAPTLPITSLSYVMGMNVIVNYSTHWVTLCILLLIMPVISLVLLRWAPQTGLVVIIRVVGSVYRCVRESSAGDLLSWDLKITDRASANPH